MNNERDELPRPFETVANLLYQESFGALDSKFLARPVSCLPHGTPVCTAEQSSVHEVMLLLKRHRFGCVLVVDEHGKLSGIFSERDYVLKVHNSELDEHSTPACEVMTRNPVTQPPEAALAHVLNLMSNGGFRHIPIVEPDGTPLWMVSVKNIMDYIVGDVGDALMNFKTSES